MRITKRENDVDDRACPQKFEVHPQSEDILNLKKSRKIAKEKANEKSEIESLTE